MGKIVAIGGGENGHHGTKYETAPFDKEIIRLTGKEKPNFLFIGLANTYADYYFEVMDGIYNGMYNCNTDYLRYKEIKNKSVVSQKIKNADIIYVGGGNTYKLMTLLRMYGINKMLIDAYSEDKVLCGVSAGGICWCDYGNSDSRKFSSNSGKLIRVSGLRLIHILFCPHYNIEGFRKGDLREMMRRTHKIPAVALDNAALEMIDDKYRILTLDNGAVAEKCYWKNGKYITQNIIDNEFHNIKELYIKD